MIQTTSKSTRILYEKYVTIIMQVKSNSKSPSVDK